MKYAGPMARRSAAGFCPGSSAAESGRALAPMPARAVEDADARRGASGHGKDSLAEDRQQEQDAAARPHPALTNMSAATVRRPSDVPNAVDQIGDACHRATPRTGGRGAASRRSAWRR